MRVILPADFPVTIAAFLSDWLCHLRFVRRHHVAWKLLEGFRFHQQRGHSDVRPAGACRRPRMLRRTDIGRLCRKHGFRQFKTRNSRRYHFPGTADRRNFAVKNRKKRLIRNMTPYALMNNVTQLIQKRRHAPNVGITSDCGA